jgi:hypothetical protein
MRIDLANLFTRPFWLDEWHTNLVANRESLAQVFSDLHRGSDFGPPLVHVVGWLLARVTGEVTPVGARLVALSCVMLALVLVFLTLRRRFGAAASVAGALAVATHPLAVAHAFELRFYCLWLACAAGFAWSLSVDRTVASSRRRDVAVATFAVLLCMSHWLAVLSLGLMAVGAMASYGRDWRAGLRRLLPATAGFIAVAIASPLVFGQRASITEKSWMPDVTVNAVLGSLDTFWADWVMILAVLVILTGLLRTRTKQPIKTSFAATVQDPSGAALLSLFLLPLLMVVISIKQPAMHERYSITVLLAWTPLVAIAVQSLGYVMRGVAYVVLVFFFLVSGLRITAAAAQFSYHANAGKAALAQACTMNLPVIFEVRHLMYPSTDGMSSRWERCDARYLAISPATLDRMFGAQSNFPRFFRIENEFADLHHRLYGYPKVARQEQVDALPRFIVVGWDDSFPVGYKDVTKFGRAVFPNHRVRRINEDLTLFERR